MIDDKRINDLKTFRDRWKEGLEELTKLRDKLLSDKAKGYRLTDENGNDVLSDRIHLVDRAVLRYHKYLIVAQARLDRALAGEDV